MSARHATGPVLADVLREAALLIASVATGKSLAGRLGGGSAPHHAALLDITHGTLRAYALYPAIVAALSQRPTAQPVAALLWCAVHALCSGRYAEYTVVDQAVRACTLLGHSGTKGYVNAVLRSYLRDRDRIETCARHDPEADLQHPHWWIDQLRAAYPQAWREILAAGNSPAPMALRVNLRRSSLEEYGARLATLGMNPRRVGPAALLLDTPVPAQRLPGFAEGEVSVQDAGAQCAASFLELADGQRVLDACAAPGGKTGHIAESAKVALTALDVAAARCALVQDNLRRLGLTADVRVADASATAQWWDGIPYDRILADVACSSSGIVRRRPDIKWLRRAQDLPAYARKQSALLSALWRVLAPDGKLLYATCSVFPAENEGVIQTFLARTPDARRLEVPGHGQLLPDREHDGFFYALLERRA